MSFINYVEPVSIGSAFMGLSSLVVAVVLAVVLWKVFMVIIKILEVYYNKEAKFELIQEAFLDRIGKEKGIDLNKELVKREMLNIKKKSFRKKIEEQIYEQMFGKEKSEPKK